MKRKNLLKPVTLASTLLLALALLTGCGAADRMFGASVMIPAAAAQHFAAGLPEGTEFLGFEEAKAAALAFLNKPDARFLADETEFDDGCYELTFASEGTEYELKVNGFTGAVVESETDKADFFPAAISAENAPASENAAAAAHIGKEEALKAAAAHFGLSLSELRDVDVEWDDDGHYEVDFEVGRTAYECDVSPTGEVFNAETDRDDIDDDDDRPAPASLDREGAEGRCSPFWSLPFRAAGCGCGRGR